MSNAMQLEHGDWELRLGDCLDPVTGLASLADGCAEHVITDPPYAARAMKNARNNGETMTQRRDGVVRDFGYAALSDDLRIGVSAEIARVVTRWVNVWCDIESASAWRFDLSVSGAEAVRIGVWVREYGAPQFSGDRPGQGVEAVVIAHGDSRKRWNGGGRPATWIGPIVNAGDPSRIHSSPKPLWLMEALVRDFTDPGDLILDPFAGSGTTGVACRRLGRRFLGWERDPKFHAAAMKRIGAAREQLGLLSRTRAPKVEQGDMFKAAGKVRS